MKSKTDFLVSIGTLFYGDHIDEPYSLSWNVFVIESHMALAVDKNK